MRLPSKSGWFLILMTLSAVSAFVLGPGWTSFIRWPLQAVGLAQWPVTAASRQVSEAVTTRGGARITVQQAEALERENEALQRQVLHQQLQLEQLASEVEELTGLRDQLPDSHVTIVLAPVLSFDANPRRDSLLVKLSKRTRALVRRGQWVVAGAFETPSRERIARQWLIGRVSDVETQVARVQLATDPAFRVGVRAAARGADGAWRLAGDGCVLDGRAAGRMMITQAPEDYLAAGYECVVVPAGPELPFPLSIGRIESSRQRDDSPAHYDLEVEPWGAAEHLTHVYIISMVP